MKGSRETFFFSTNEDLRFTPFISLLLGFHSFINYGVKFTLRNNLSSFKRLKFLILILKTFQIT